MARADETPQIDVGPPRIESPDDFSSLNEERVHRNGTGAIEDLLRDVPGLAVARSGGAGQQSWVFIRGASSAGTLVLLDGLPLNDPSLPNRTFDFSNLSLDNIERVEVWKGPQSVLFGSGATGGVINVVTKKGQGPLKIGGDLLVGSQNTLNAGAFLHGSTSRLSYSLEAGEESTQGISASSRGRERDGRVRSTASTRLGYAFDRRTDLELIGRWSEHRTELDYAPAPGFATQVDAPDYRTQGHAGTLGLRFGRAWNESWRSTLMGALADQEHNFRNDPSSENAKLVDQAYSGTTTHLEEKNFWRFFEGAELQFGPALDFESMHSRTEGASFARHSDSLAGLMARVQIDRRSWFLTAGARWDSHSLFGAQESWELAPGLHLTPQLDLFVRGAMGYRAPTLYNLYDPTYGNDGLKPEQVRGGDLSLRRQFSQGHVQLTYFASRARHLISFESVGGGQFRYLNEGSGRSSGVELEAEWRREWWGVTGGYTYLDTFTDETHSSQRHQPRNALSARLEVGRATVGSVYGALEFESADHRLDSDPVTGQEVVTASDQVLNASVAWKATGSLKLYVRALNLMDLRYDEVAGYGAYPFSIYAGVTFAR